MAFRDILIVGATGQQGKAAIFALYASKLAEARIRILALTRSASSPKAQELQQKHTDLLLVEGDIRNPSPIFEKHPQIQSIFLVTVPPNEEDQALPFIKAATAGGRRIDHIVFSSVDRGGDQGSWENPTPVSHFAAKHRIELELRKACDASNIRWTILRPTGFMDNYNPGTFGALMASLWANGPAKDKRMQLISTHDIGKFAAKPLLSPEDWNRKAAGLVGDEITFAEAERVFEKVLGKRLPRSYWVVSKAVLWWFDDARTSFDWFADDGYHADLEFCRREETSLQSFEAWLRESSQWKLDEEGDNSG